MTHPCRYTDDSSYDYSDYFEGKGYYAQTHDDDDDGDLVRVASTHQTLMTKKLQVIDIRTNKQTGKKGVLDDE